MRDQTLQQVGHRPTVAQQARKRKSMNKSPKRFEPARILLRALAVLVLVLFGLAYRQRQIQRERSAERLEESFREIHENTNQILRELRDSQPEEGL